jgi:4-diphosphocytidyl-2C-methyl-D-erythritol kinase
LGNDLLPAAISLCPAIARLIDAMQSLAGCCYACMTGSGSVVFGLFADKAVAYQAYRQMIIDKDAYLGVFDRDAKGLVWCGCSNAALV